MTVSVDNVDHIRQRAVATVHGTIEIVHQQRVLNAVLLSAIFGELQLLFPRCVRRIVFSRMRFSHINRQELESAVLILFVKADSAARPRRRRAVT